MTKGFYVNTDKLKAVSEQIASLLQDLADDDATHGTPASLQERGSSIGPATATFWGGDTNNFFAYIYGEEMKYINLTYGELVKQLTAVKSACDNTVQQYATQESNAKHDVSSNDTQF